MRGLRITANMAEPIVTGIDGLHLDGILALGAYRSLSREEQSKLPPVWSEKVVDFDLPLAKWTAEVSPDDVDGSLLDDKGLAWGWVASREITDVLNTGKYEVRKRPAVDEMIRLSSDRTYHLSSGPMKAYDLAFPTSWSPRVGWIAVGDRDGVKRLLGLVRGIGKKSAVGMGRVMEWCVEHDDGVTVEMVSAVRRMPSRDGHVMRGVRPPYHHPSRRAPC